MADKEIPELDPADLPLDGTEEIHIVQSGNSRRAAISALAASAAVNVTYDNMAFSGGSGLLAEDVQAAIDELAAYVFAASSAFTDGDKGDIIVSDSGATWTVEDGVITNSKLADMATATIKGRTTAGTGDPEDLTVAQATAMLNAVVGDSGAGGTKGLVPAPSAGDAAAGKFLKADGTWQVGSTVGDLDDLTDVSVPSPSQGDVLTYSSGVWTSAAPTGGSGGPATTSEYRITLAASDETTALTIGDSKITFYADADATITEVFTGLTEPSASGSVTIDVRLNGTTIFSTPPSIEAGEDTSLTGTVAILDGTVTWSKGDKVEIDIDAAGAAAAGLKVTFIGTTDAVLELPDFTANAGKVLAVNSTSDGVEWVQAVGKQTVWIPASAMLPATTSGAATGQIETTTNKINAAVLDFDDAADEYAHFHVAFPKSWNKGTVTFQAFWTTTATGTTGVAWALEGIAVSDNEAADTAWGTAVVVTDDAQGATTEILVTAESAAVTIGGTPVDEDVCFFRVTRDVSDANDDMTEDARLIGIKLFYNTEALTDD